MDQCTVNQCTVDRCEGSSHFVVVVCITKATVSDHPSHTRACCSVSVSMFVGARKSAVEPANARKPRSEMQMRKPDQQLSIYSVCCCRGLIPFSASRNRFAFPWPSQEPKQRADSCGSSRPGKAQTNQIDGDPKTKGPTGDGICKHQRRSRTTTHIEHKTSRSPIGYTSPGPMA